MALDKAKSRVQHLSSFFANNPLPKSDAPAEWFAYLAKFKDELGNFSNAVSFFATLMAEEYLVHALDMAPFDAIAKAQGAPGLDIDATTTTGTRVIAEIKTTHPYKIDDLGAKQIETFWKDAKKLRLQNAEHKFFFLTDRATFELMKKPKYRQLFESVRVVLLPSGEEITA